MKLCPAFVELDVRSDFSPEEWALSAVVLRPSAEILLIANNEEHKRIMTNVLKSKSNRLDNITYTVKERLRYGIEDITYSNGSKIKIMNLGENPWCKVHGQRFDIIIVSKYQYKYLSNKDCSPETVRDTLIRPMLRFPIEFDEMDFFRFLVWKMEKEEKKE